MGLLEKAQQRKQILKKTKDSGESTIVEKKKEEQLFISLCFP